MCPSSSAPTTSSPPDVDATGPSQCTTPHEEGFVQDQSGRVDRNPRASAQQHLALHPNPTSMPTIMPFVVVRRTTREGQGHPPSPHHHSPPRHSLWALWVAVLVVCSFLSIVLSTIYFPSSHYFYDSRDTRREASLLAVELDTALMMQKWKSRRNTPSLLGQSARYNNNSNNNNKVHAIAWLLSFPNSVSEQEECTRKEVSRPFLAY